MLATTADVVASPPSRSRAFFINESHAQQSICWLMDLGWVGVARWRLASATTVSNERDPRHYEGPPPHSQR